VIAYDGAAEVIALVRRGGGALVSSVYTEDRSFATEVVLGIAPFHGRVTVVNAKVSGAWLGPGTVLPQLLHGGPGRAGGGEELGGIRGMTLYLQRVAIQGYGPLVEHITGSKRALGSATSCDSGLRPVLLQTLESTDVFLATQQGIRCLSWRAGDRV
jgi:3,4-dehydroadipyl-CoA semialdehyde dehydrogenase